MITVAAVRKWTLRSLTIVLVSCAASILWVDHQLRRFAGGGTEVVDHAAFSAAPGPMAVIDVHALSEDGETMRGGRHRGARRWGTR